MVFIVSVIFAPALEKPSLRAAMVGILSLGRENSSSITSFIAFAISIVGISVILRGDGALYPLKFLALSSSSQTPFKPLTESESRYRSDKANETALWIFAPACPKPRALAKRLHR